jgi:hypothetical protein
LRSFFKKICLMYNFFIVHLNFFFKSLLLRYYYIYFVYYKRTNFNLKKIFLSIYNNVISIIFTTTEKLVFFFEKFFANCFTLCITLKEKFLYFFFWVYNIIDDFFYETYGTIKNYIFIRKFKRRHIISPWKKKIFIWWNSLFLYLFTIKEILFLILVWFDYYFLIVIEFLVFSLKQLDYYFSIVIDFLLFRLMRFDYYFPIVIEFLLSILKQLDYYFSIIIEFLLFRFRRFDYFFSILTNVNNAHNDRVILPEYIKRWVDWIANFFHLEDYISDIKSEKYYLLGYRLYIAFWFINIAYIIFIWYYVYLLAFPPYTPEFTTTFKTPMDYRHILMYGHLH